MRLAPAAAALLSISSTIAKPDAEFTPCPLLGPFWPAVPPPNQPPSNATSPALRKAFRSFRRQLDTIVKTGKTDGHGPVTPETTTFSLALFSALDGETFDGVDREHPFFFEYHHTAPALQKMSSSANDDDHEPRKVNKDSIYRIGEMSELLTIYTFLVEAGDGHWHEPVTKWVPELRELSKNVEYMRGVNENLYVDWREVKLGELASHMAGIARSYGSDEVTNKSVVASLRKEHGFPGVNDTANSKCGLRPLCDRKEFLDRFSKMPPVAYPSTTPAWSTAGIQILAYALEGITGKPFEKLLANLVEQLEMNRTSLAEPDRKNVVVPGDEQATGWSLNRGEKDPATSIYSTLTDLSMLGTSILKSTLLPKSQTRRWLKPVAHTSNHANSIGYGWEIYSAGDPRTDPVVDIYTKRGNLGHYSSYIGIVPDLAVGYAILAADTEGNPDLNAYADVIGDSVQPLLEEMALSGAAHNYGGEYHALNDDGTNSSMTIRYDDQPGLFVTDLNSHGKDARAGIAQVNGIKPSALSFRLYPTNLQKTIDSGSRFPFRAVFQDEDALQDAGTPTCETWRDVGRNVYGEEPLDLVIFETGPSGEAESVYLPALRLTLRRAK
ncbi:MAG: hypothetical protein M1831_001104 [Alyxoria varia]|nr:MAG: hypothetical protein M1831_001104 [Alyxoria varia]